jgi:hypothetical protein
MRRGFLFILLLPMALSAAELPWEFIENRCFDCHDADSAKGGVNLEEAGEDWTNPATEKLWGRALDAVEKGMMPPKKKKQPSAVERAGAVKSLHAVLAANSKPGGSVIRRLNRHEYESSVQIAFRVPFKAPVGFPEDEEHHGFDNNASALALSPPLMAQYFDIATQVADLLIPPAKTKVDIKPEIVKVAPGDMSMNFAGSQLRDGVMRLNNKGGILIRSCSWPTRFDAPYTGTYEFSARLSGFKPRTDAPLTVDLLVITPSMTFTEIPPLKRAASLQVPADGKVHEVKASFDLERGQTVAFYWANASHGWNKDGARTDPSRQIHEILKRKPELYAAWLKIGGWDRQRTNAQTWELLKKTMAAGTLDLSNPKVKNPPDKFPATTQNQLNGAIEHMLTEDGPALDIHGVTFLGPTELKESRDDIAQRQRTERFLGERKGRSDREWAKAVLRPTLEKAFRRPPTDEQTKAYVDIAAAHVDAGNRFEDGIHLAVRTMLCSPHFLYRNHREGALDDYDLAARLSYFLSLGPPDSRLIKLAGEGKLHEPHVLKVETERLLKHYRARQFLNRFLGQWLDLDELGMIMPDERLMRWTSREQQAIEDETRMFVTEILEKNLPMETFVDPDFTYMNDRSARLYGRKDVKGQKMKRVAVPRGGRFGGILGQASVMMATANGVDTQPVLRGVWLAENVLGTPPPPPPENVPAIEPDTTGAKGIRELLEKHKTDQSCAACHQTIDPLGFALENFDPIGRWREHYPVYKKQGNGKWKSLKGPVVDATGVMPDGSQFKDVTDLKKYLVANIDMFSACLADKLLVYATGRDMNYADRQVIKQIVKDVKADGNGFRDLIVAIVLSESFAVK